MAALIITILLVPLQLFCMGYVRKKEYALVLEFQTFLSSNYPNCTDKYQFCNQMITWPTRLF